MLRPAQSTTAVRAGKTRGYAITSSNRADHPRSRGENGKVSVGQSESGLTTPARAGRTWQDPRQVPVCHGLPPLARGEPAAQRRTSTTKRTTPGPRCAALLPDCCRRPRAIRRCGPIVWC